MLKSLAAITALALAPVALAQDETSPPMPRSGGMPSPDQIFVFMDANKDGSIAKEEAKGPLAQHFDHIDGDKDGKISPAELKTAIAAMRPPQSDAEGPAQ